MAIYYGNSLIAGGGGGKEWYLFKSEIDNEMTIDLYEVVQVAEYVIQKYGTPIYGWASLICKEDECGWKKGDVVNIWGRGENNCVPPLNLFIDKYGLHMECFWGSGSFWVFSNDNYEPAQITTDKWALVYRCIMEKA